MGISNFPKIGVRIVRPSEGRREEFESLNFIVYLFFIRPCISYSILYDYA